MEAMRATRTLVRGSIGDDELDFRGLGWMPQEHLLNQDAAQAMSEENHLAMLPDVVFFEAGPEQVGQLHTGHFAIGRRRGILGDINVGIGKARVGPNHIRPISAVRRPPGLAVPVNAMHKNNDSCAPRRLRAGRLRTVRLLSGLCKEWVSAEQEKKGD